MHNKKAQMVKTWPNWHKFTREGNWARGTRSGVKSK